ncbi:MAG TPA: hypothetical protein PJ986_04170 [Gammaproteobacteria bacterium]|nr:hypothetical protein [Gammaproteobacteria bacterium]
MRYGAIARSLWQEPRYKSLSASAKLVACYLQTCPAGNSAHIFRIGPAEIGLACSLALRVVRTALVDIEAVGLAAVDLEHELVWLEAQMLAELGPSLKPGDNRVTYLRKLVAELPPSPIVADFVNRYGAAYQLENKGPSKDPRKGPSDPLRTPFEAKDKDKGNTEDLTSKEDPSEVGSTTTRARGERVSAGGAQ